MTLAMRSPLSCVVMTAPSGCGGDEGAEDGAVARADGELRVPLHAGAEAVPGRLDALAHAAGRQRVHQQARAGLRHRLAVSPEYGPAGAGVERTSAAAGGEFCGGDSLMDEWRM